VSHRHDRDCKKPRDPTRGQPPQRVGFSVPRDGRAAVLHQGLNALAHKAHVQYGEQEQYEAEIFELRNQVTLQHMLLRFVNGNGENRFGSEEPGRPLVPLTSTDHAVPYPAGCRRSGSPTLGPKPTSGSRAGEFCTSWVPSLRSSTAAAAVLAPRDSD